MEKKYCEALASSLETMENRLDKEITELSLFKELVTGCTLCGQDLTFSHGALIALEEKITLHIDFLNNLATDLYSLQHQIN